MKPFKKISNKNIPNISGEWTSTFIESNSIFNEYISIKQQCKKIEAAILLNRDKKIFHYQFVGQIQNKVIHGTYVSTKTNKKENGTISLQLINKDLLFGSCTFFNINEHSDIIQSPYILTRNDKNKVGTFKFCKYCVGKESCCNHVGVNIDMPVILPSEVETIKRKYQINIDKFASVVSLNKKENDKSLKSLYQIKRDPNTGICTFYKNNQCTIYEDRPIDCRMFPFDIKLMEDRKCYLIHYNSNKCNINGTKSDCIKNTSYNVRLFIRIILPYLREWSVDRFSIKLTTDRPYTIICPIEDLF